MFVVPAHLLSCLCTLALMLVSAGRGYGLESAVHPRDACPPALPNEEQLYLGNAGFYL